MSDNLHNISVAGNSNSAPSNSQIGKPPTYDQDIEWYFGRKLPAQERANFDKVYNEINDPSFNWRHATEEHDNAFTVKLRQHAARPDRDRDEQDKDAYFKLLDDRGKTDPAYANSSEKYARQRLIMRAAGVEDDDGVDYGVLDLTEDVEREIASVRASYLEWQGIRMLMEREASLVPNQNAGSPPPGENEEAPGHNAAAGPLPFGDDWRSDGTRVDNGASAFVDPYQDFAGALFPPGILPSLLADLVDAEDRSMGVDRSAIAMGALTVVAGATHADTTIKMGESWKEPPMLWTMLLSSSSGMKTPLFRKLTKPLADIDHAREIAWQAQHTAWANAKRANPKTAGPFPPRPAECLIDDCTPEKTVKILARDRAGSLMARDELAGLLASFERPGVGQYNRSVIVGCYNGGPRKFSRVGQGVKDETADTYIENCALSILGGIQNEVLEKSRDLTSDGFMQRWVVAPMDIPSDPDTSYPVAAVETEYGKLINSVKSMTPRMFEFAPDAVPVRERILKYLGSLRHMQGFDRALVSAIGKLPGLFGRLTLALHVASEHSAIVRCAFEADRPAISGIISRDTAEKAERLVREYVLYNTFALYEQVLCRGIDRKDIHAVADFILTRKKDHILYSDFSGHGPRVTRNKTPKEIADWASRFVGMGWLQPEDERLIPKAWTRAPGLREYFAERTQLREEANAAVNAILRAGGTRPTSKQPAADEQEHAV
jgi:Protein of unknown function (DUF3987)